MRDSVTRTVESDSTVQVEMKVRRRKPDSGLRSAGHARDRLESRWLAFGVRCRGRTVCLRDRVTLEQDLLPCNIRLEELCRPMQHRSLLQAHTLRMKNMFTYTQIDETSTTSPPPPLLLPHPPSGLRSAVHARDRQASRWLVCQQRPSPQSSRPSRVGLD